MVVLPERTMAEILIELETFSATATLDRDLEVDTAPSHSPPPGRSTASPFSPSQGSTNPSPPVGTSQRDLRGAPDTLDKDDHLTRLLSIEAKVCGLGRLIDEDV